PCETSSCRFPNPALGPTIAISKMVEEGSSPPPSKVETPKVRSLLLAQSSSLRAPMSHRQKYANVRTVTRVTYLTSVSRAVQHVAVHLLLFLAHLGHFRLRVCDVGFRRPCGLTSRRPMMAACDPSRTWAFSQYRDNSRRV